MSKQYITVDGNEAAASVAYRASEVVAIYPITPASPMGELSDAWASKDQPNVWGNVPEIVELQSEGGAAGALHGAVTAGALGTTFTASQGLLLMLPNMYKIAGELTSTVIHVAARSVATHALSIFGDHSDVMATRQSGFAMLCSSSVQEAHDMALIAHAATLRSRIPFLHFFDGFRTSHELHRIERIGDEVLLALIDQDAIRAHRARGLSPDDPVLRGSAQNPDVFFQAREAQNSYYAEVPGIVQATMDQLAEQTGRGYRLVDYVGAEDAERVVVLMGSGLGAAEEAVERMCADGEKVGLLKLRLYRPFPTEAFLAALPRTVRSVAVLDRTKEPGAPAEPLFLDVMTSISEGWTDAARPRVIGGRFGLSSKQFTPAMVMSVFSELQKDEPKPRFTVGIYDDVTHLSLEHDSDAFSEPDEVLRAVFFGLGSDGTVGASKNTVKILGEEAEFFAQGYFVYDSKKAGSVTVSHLRFSRSPIRSTYQIRSARFVACHHPSLLERLDVLGRAAPEATLLLNSSERREGLWDSLPREVQSEIIRKKLRVFAVDADEVAREAGLGRRINTVLQTCFFALSELLPRDEAIDAIKAAIKKTYDKLGAVVLDRNYAAVDRALEGLFELEVPDSATSERVRPKPVTDDAPEFVQRFTARIIAGEGDLLPVSAMPVDGTFPTGTARFEKRGLAHEIPIWDADICIECAKCTIVCPHAAIRMKVYEPEHLEHKPESFRSRPWTDRASPGRAMTIQVLPDDCTGCGVCVDVCPAHSKEVVRHKAINMETREDHLAQERAAFAFFDGLSETDLGTDEKNVVKASQMREPLFDASGACAGCGETPYLKLLTQLYGDRVVIANATGCSSIYGGNLPTTPWSTNRDGRGPAWSNSLFEDNAEFGLGMRLALDRRRAAARVLLVRLAPSVGDELSKALLEFDDPSDAAIKEQRGRVEALKEKVASIDSEDARNLAGLADALVPKQVWIVGGDGWAYDIGFGGLDHVLASGRDVNILVLDTEVYSNTGGQASKATPRAAVAKFAAGGKTTGKKDLGMIAMAYGDVYVAHIAIGGSDTQTVKAFQEAASWRGPSLLIAYSHCIAHGIDMRTSMTHQKDAVKSGYWPLYSYDPRMAVEGKKPLRLDSRAPSLPLSQFMQKEARFAILARSNPKQAEALQQLAQADVHERWRLYEQTADIERSLPDHGE